MYELHDGKGRAAVIGSGASALLGAACRECAPGIRAALITDGGVPGEHIEKAAEELEAAGFAVFTFVIPRGEENKNLASLEAIWGFLYDKGFTRTDAVVGLGGGMVGDTAGFAAAVYKRGLPFVSVPTTIISQTDSAYGGKTGVDFREGKNLIGAFSRPAAIICDTDFLATLPEEERVSGLGEVIKYGAIAEPSILENVARDLPSDETVFACAKIKQSFVLADPFDMGERRVLNFGHTFGHAFEEASGFRLPHGRAVALGMLAAIRLGERLGVTESGVYEAVESACERAGLGARWEALTADALPLLPLDKKSDGASLDFVLLERLGRPVRRRLPFELIARLMG
ncbi:MAG: 3-dehydroquinate synthase [Clostridiales bacterium]|nr:3-dehydroquinate synthase [Clostridiales bacterium]